MNPSYPPEAQRGLCLSCIHRLWITVQQNKTTWIKQLSGNTFNSIKPFAVFCVGSRVKAFQISQSHAPQDVWLVQEREGFVRRREEGRGGRAPPQEMVWFSRSISRSPKPLMAVKLSPYLWGMVTGSHRLCTNVQRPHAVIQTHCNEVPLRHIYTIVIFHRWGLFAFLPDSCKTFICAIILVMLEGGMFLSFGNKQSKRTWKKKQR